MGRVRLEISSALACILNTKDSGVIIEKEIGEWTTIGSLLADLVFDLNDSGGMVFNRETREVGEQIMVILNGSLLQLSEVAEVILKDGDTILLLPVAYGG